MAIGALGRCSWWPEALALLRRLGGPGIDATNAAATALRGQGLWARAVALYESAGALGRRLDLVAQNLLVSCLSWRRGLEGTGDVITLTERLSGSDRVVFGRVLEVLGLERCRNRPERAQNGLAHGFSGGFAFDDAFS